MAADSPTIQFGASGGGLYIAVCGRATQRTCPAADRLAADYLASGPPQPQIIIDVAGCDWVDSTFAGWMTGLAARLRSTPGAQVVLNRCSPRCRASLAKMHLETLFRFEQTPPPETLEQLVCETSDRPDAATLKLMLAAHENLAARDPQNAKVFAPIVEMLRRQLAQSPPPG